MAQTIGSLDLNAFSDLYSNSTQYFWFESNASATYGAGAHITLVPDTTFISNPTGQNILMNTDGFSIRNGLLPMMTLDNNSLNFNVINIMEGTYTKTATFTATGAQIGQSGGAHSVIDANGQRFYATNGTTQLANIGYGEGVNATGSTSIAPYYTLGRREDGSTIGNYSVAECAFTTASAYASHAEGHMTIASGSWGSHAEGELTIAGAVYSHAEGRKTSARGAGSHAEGYCTHGIGSVNGIDASGNGSHAEGWAGSNTNQKITASGIGSHAEGYADGIHGNIEASGNGSHAQGAGTKAQSDYQTVIGTSNIVDSTDNHAFIIGNGTADDARSNALTVDWDGNVEATGGVTIRKSATAQKDLTYVNEYVRLTANQTASESAGQLTLSTSNKNCLVANKYDEIWSDYMNECVSVTNGVVTILKSGRYRFDYQVYFYNGFTANDIPTCGIGLNGLNGALLRASRFKATVTNPYTTLSGSYTGWGEKGNTFYLIAQNSTGARGVVGLSQYTRLVVTCLMTH